MSVITYKQAAVQRIYAFVSGANGHLYVNYWNGSQWKWADQGTPQGTTVHPTLPGVITYEQGGVQRIYAFVSGANGHLYVNYWNGSQWKWADQGTPPGTTMFFSPSIISYLDPVTSVRRTYAFVRGDNFHLYVNYWNGSQWKWADQGTPPGTIVFGNASAAVITYQEGGTQRIYAFVRGATEHLYVNYWNGSEWKWADQGTPQGTNVLSTLPGVITYQDGGTQRIYAFVTGDNKHLYANYWNGSQWSWADQGTPPGTTVFEKAAAEAITYQEGGTQQIYAFVRGDNNHLYVNYWNGSQWHWADQGTPSGTTVGSVVGVTSYQEGGTQRIYAFVRGDNNHLYVNYWNGYQWHWANQGTPSGTTVLG